MRTPLSTPKLVHEVFSVRDFRPNGRHAQTLGDPVQRYASLSQLSGIGFASVRDLSAVTGGGRGWLLAAVFALSIENRVHMGAARLVGKPGTGPRRTRPPANMGQIGSEISY